MAYLACYHFLDSACERKQTSSTPRIERPYDGSARNLCVLPILSHAAAMSASLCTSDPGAFELVTLGSRPVRLDRTSWPPWPLIGIGPLDAADAHQVDVVAPTPATLEQIILSIRRHPHAAMTLVQLLRVIADLDVDAALPLESLAFAVLQGSGDFASWLASRASPQQRDGHEGTNVRLERCGNHLDIILDRPDTHNAIDRAMRDALYEAFDLVATDRTIATVAVRGEGRCFSVGGDLAEFGTTRDPALAHAIRCRTLPATRLRAQAACYTFHLHGGCIGAAIEMAAFGGTIIARPDTWFHLPELAMGLIPGAGGCVSIPRRIGRQRTALMVLTGKRITAATALEWGLIDAIAPGASKHIMGRPG